MIIIIIMKYTDWSSALVYSVTSDSNYKNYDLN